ncbi:MAG: histidinol dehydrogenase [Acidobacteriota bacterium]|jgi:histidinol dehydrogenase|nr:MAG: histidinol dehydrogenase [Acidobacteriota bacterium]
MRIIRTSDRQAIDALVARDEARDPKVERQAARIVDDVRKRGDEALIEWTRKLDRTTRSARQLLRPLSRAELDRGWSRTPAGVRRSLALAADNIRKVAERQVPRGFTVSLGPGHRIEQRVEPLGRVGCYVPGGRHPLPSTLLMTAIPARAAGVGTIVAVCPSPAPVVLAAAVEAGVDALYTLGGAQAVAALAYGTGSIERVDKIVGPGNAWVAAAKAYVSRDCPIDLHAGPSEIVVCSDAGKPAWIAADLIAQAEHDPAARAVFVTTKMRLALAVAAEIERQLPASGPAPASLQANGAIVVASSRREAAVVVDRLAPEHLVIDDGDDPSRYRAAGTIFVGDYSVQAAGDYCTGSNHVLPTGGAARFRGGLSAADFVRVFSVQRLSRAALQRIGPAAVTLAEAEGLVAHAASVRARLDD